MIRCLKASAARASSRKSAEAAVPARMQKQVIILPKSHIAPIPLYGFVSCQVYDCKPLKFPLLAVCTGILG